MTPDQLQLPLPRLATHVTLLAAEPRKSSSPAQRAATRPIKEVVPVPFWHCAVPTCLGTMAGRRLAKALRPARMASRPRSGRWALGSESHL